MRSITGCGIWLEAALSRKTSGLPFTSSSRIGKSARTRSTSSACAGLQCRCVDRSHRRCFRHAAAPVCAITARSSRSTTERTGMRSMTAAPNA